MKHHDLKKVSTGLRRRAALPIACYLLALVCWLVLGTLHWADDAMARSGGLLYEADLPLSRFQLVDLAAGEGGYTTTSGDPQIILEDVSDSVVRTLSYTPHFTENEPREICLYYTTAHGEPYSQDRRVFPAVQPDGTYLFTLPRTDIVSLRLDPCSPDVGKPVTFTFEGGVIRLNDRLPGALDYFIPSWHQCFCLILYPALAASAAHWLLAVCRWLRTRKN